MQHSRGAKVVIAIGLCLAMLGVAACSSSSKDSATKPSGSTKSGGDTSLLRIAAPSGPRGLDPYNCGNGPEQNILMSGYDTLIRSAPDGTFQPSLALSWKYSSPTVFTMQLRTGVTFDDGTPVTAKVVADNLTRATHTLGAITAALALATKSVTVAGPNAVTITLRTPNPDLENIMSTCAGMIVNPKLLAKPADMATKMDGTGPYNYDSGASVGGSTYTFTQKTKYWNAAAYPFKKVVFKIIADFNTAFNAIRSGQVDFAVGTPAERSSAKAAGLDLVQGNINFYAIDLRDREGTLVPALKDVRVRQALNYAIDRAAVIKTFFEDLGRNTDQVLSSDAAAYDKALDDSYPYDPDKAKDLLKQAGYADGFNLPVLSTQSFQLDQILQAIGGYWSKIGVKVKADVLQESNWAQSLISNKYPAVIFPFAGLPEYTALSQPFGPASPLNPFHTTDAALDSALTAAATAPSESDRTASIKSAQKTLLDQAWYAGTGYDTVIWFFNPKKVTGIEMQQYQSVPHFYDWKPGA